MSGTVLNDARRKLVEAVDSKLSHLVTDPGEEVAMFHRLTRATFDCLAATDHWRAFAIRLHPESAFNPCTWSAELPPDLLSAWQDWPMAYARLVARNPRLDVADLLSEVSEAHDATSWPAGWEDQIEDWVLSGDAVHPPFDVRSETDVARIHARLRDLKPALCGWLWWSDAEKRVIFGDQSDWDIERARRSVQRREISRMRQEIVGFLEHVKAKTSTPSTTTAKQVASDNKSSPLTYPPMQQFRIKPKADPD